MAQRVDVLGVKRGGLSSRPQHIPKRKDRTSSVKLSFAATRVMRMPTHTPCTHMRNDSKDTRILIKTIFLVAAVVVPMFCGSPCGLLKNGIQGGYL